MISQDKQIQNVSSKFYLTAHRNIGHFNEIFVKKPRPHFTFLSHLATRCAYFGICHSSSQ